MRTYLLLLLICPVLAFAQNQPTQQANGATDCPTFGKKNVSGKASLFQYMRTHKPQRTQDPRELQPAYRTSALPNLQEAQESRNAAVNRREKDNEKTVAKTRRQRRSQPDTEEEQTVIPVPAHKTKPDSPDLAEVNPAKQPTTKETRPATKEPVNEVSEASNNTEEAIEPRSVTEETEANAAAKEKRDKKIKKAAFKSKWQHLFKRTNKPTSRKHVEKCPSF